jgi:hypothetical protein
VLDLGTKEITLTCEQAQKLKEALDELFGKGIVREVHHHDYPHWYFYQPVYETPKPQWFPYTISWGDSTSMCVTNDTMTLSLTG